MAVASIQGSYSISRSVYQQCTEAGKVATL